MKLIERCATDADSSWLFGLYAELLQSPIERQWGWNETFQKEYFSKNLAARRFTLCLINGNRVAAYYINNEVDHFYLKMLLVPTVYQRQGIGRKVVEQFKERAIQQQKSIKLSVIKANSVLGFYKELGFDVINESVDSFHLECRYKGASLTCASIGSNGL